jgi:hypothetical protein
MVEITAHGVVSVLTKVINVNNPSTVGCRPYKRVEVVVKDSNGTVFTLALYAKEPGDMMFSHLEVTQ